MSLVDTLFGWTGLLATPFEKATKGMVPSPISGATGKVLLEGTVREPDIPLVAPFTGAPCVFWAASHAEEAVITRTDGQGNAESVTIWREHFKSGGACSFQLVDAGGGLAQVSVDAGLFEAAAHDALVSDPSLLWGPGVIRATWNQRVHGAASVVEIGARGTTFVAGFDVVKDNPRVDAMPPDLDAFLRARGVLATQYMSIVREHRLTEGRIGPNERVLVLGEARTALGAQGDGYRGGGPITIVRPTFIVAPRG